MFSGRLLKVANKRHFFKNKFHKILVFNSKFSSKFSHSASREIFASFNVFGFFKYFKIVFPLKTTFDYYNSVLLNLFLSMSLYLF